MKTTNNIAKWFGCLAVILYTTLVPAGAIAEDKVAPSAPLRIFTCGHSFHYWMPPILSEVEAAGRIPVHQQIGRSGIGGSRVIQHWDANKEKVHEHLEAGEVDVLTLSPMFTPQLDPGIENFGKLAVAHNPNIRITVQEFWLPFDKLVGFNDTFFDALDKQLRTWTSTPPATELTTKNAPLNPDATKDRSGEKLRFDVPTIEQVKKLHEPYFNNFDETVIALNKQFGKQVYFVVPVGQAVIALRQKILEGKAPGLLKQSDLFTDGCGHPLHAIEVLSAYCHYAVIYHRSPVGLPMIPFLQQPKEKSHDPVTYTPELNLLLQQLAWDAVIHHPLSGVTANNP